MPPITVDERFVRDIIRALNELRAQIPNVVGGGGGSPLDSMVVLAGSNQFPSGIRVRDAIRKVGTDMGSRVLKTSADLEKLIEALEQVLVASDDAEYRNTGNARF